MANKQIRLRLPNIAQDSDRSPLPPPSTPGSQQQQQQRDLRSLMTSPVEDFEPFENEDEILGDTTVRNDDYDEEEEDGEELFGDNMEK